MKEEKKMFEAVDYEALERLTEKEEMVTVIFSNEWVNPEKVTLPLSQVPDRYL